MGNPYTSQSSSGYNTVPPSDDGATTEANRVKWSTIRTKLTDVLKTFVEAVDSQAVTAFGKIAYNNVTSTGGSYTVLSSDQGKVIRITGAGTITTPSAATVGQPFMFVVRNEHSAAVTIDGSGAETINGSATFSLSTGQTVTLMTDGTNWYTAGGFIPLGADAGEVYTVDQAYTALASASQVNIGAAATKRVNITGTSTILSFDTVAEGIERYVRFDGALTLTHNATSLILPGGADITTTAGDYAKFVSEGSGNWRSEWYTFASEGVNVQTFTTDGTYTKPTGASRIHVQVWGAGGSGGRGQNVITGGGGGGGGGSYSEMWFDAGDVGATETVTIGTGGTSISTNNTNGNAGGDTTFGSLLTGYGGGGGARGNNGGSGGGGGGGGGSLAAGATGSTTTQGQGGSPSNSGNATSHGFGGGNGSGGQAGSAAGTAGAGGHGGGGGGGGTSAAAAGAGGASLYGGGGGGGANSGGGSNGAGGTSTYGGNGGAGATDTTAATAGTVPGGGGGGTEGGTTGAGADGQIIVTTWK